MKNIIPENKKGQPHGYCEWYWTNGSLWYKRFYNNGKRVGYSERYYWNDDELSHKKYYI